MTAPKNIKSIQTLVEAFLRLEADSINGATVAELHGATGISEYTIRKILRTVKGFEKSLRPGWPPGFWCDLTRLDIDRPDVVKPVRQPVKTADVSTSNALGTVTAEYRPTNLRRTITTKEIIHNLTKIIEFSQAETAKYTDLLAAASEASLMFAQNGGVLPTPKYRAWNEQANELRKYLEQALKLVALYQDDPRLSTPEYWTVFCDVE